MSEASYRSRARARIQSKSLPWAALALGLLLSAVLLGGAQLDDVAWVPAKAVRWFLGLDEADRFSIPIHSTESGVDP